MTAATSHRHRNLTFRRRNTDTPLEAEPGGTGCNGPSGTEPPRGRQSSLLGLKDVWNGGERRRSSIRQTDLSERRRGSSFIGTSCPMKASRGFPRKKKEVRLTRRRKQRRHSHFLFDSKQEVAVFSDHPQTRVCSNNWKKKSQIKSNRSVRRFF